ncbi:hypothetical protein H5T88_08530 [bacterium]|nr:hypothetical protein [bacterium]
MKMKSGTKRRRLALKGVNALDPAWRECSMVWIPPSKLGLMESILFAVMRRSILRFG